MNRTATMNDERKSNHEPMFLSVNIGNTNIVFGLYELESEKLRRIWRVSSVPRRTEDEHRLILRGLLGEERGAWRAIKGCLISSVVPRLEKTLNDCVRRLLGIEPLVLSHGLDMGI